MTNTDVMESIRKERTLEMLRSRLQTLKSAAFMKKQAEQNYQEVASAVKTALKEVAGTNGTPVRFWVDGDEHAAILSKPKPELSWNLELLVPWLQENGFWDKVSTQVVDPLKLASEISVGNIVLTEEQTAAFQYMSKDVAASVRFVNPTSDSL